MTELIEALVVIGIIVLFSCGIVNSCEKTEYVANCILENSKLLNVEEICESRWRLK